MELGLTGRTVIVTGASMGIGRAVAVSMAQEGANIVLCARREQPLAEAVSEIESRGGAAIGVSCDVTDPLAASIVLERANARFGAVDILINNAGRSMPRKLLATTDDDWVAGMDLNFLSAVRFTRACLPSMIDRHWGRIINVSSTTAKLADPYHPIYGAAKAALISFSKTVSVSFAKEGVRCNCVLPGITYTASTDRNLDSAVAATGSTREELMVRMLARAPIPIGRIAEPAEIADAIVFLAPNNADWITGVTLPLDGGTIPVAG